MLLTENLNETTAELLKRLSEESFQHRLPLVIYLLINIILSVVGNSLVLLVYTQHFIAPTVPGVYIIVMAVADLLAGLVAMPLQLATIRYAYNIDNEWFCRGMFISAGVTTQSSGLCLIILAVERRRMICMIPSTYVSIQQAWRKTLATVVFSVTLFGAYSPLYGVRQLTVNNVTVSMCWYQKKYEDTVYHYSYRVCTVTIFLLGFFGLFLSYSQIAKRLRKRSMDARDRRVGLSVPAWQPSSNTQREQLPVPPIITRSVSSDPGELFQSTVDDLEQKPSIQHHSWSVGRESVDNVNHDVVQSLDLHTTDTHIMTHVLRRLEALTSSIRLPPHTGAVPVHVNPEWLYRSSTAVTTHSWQGNPNTENTKVVLRDIADPQIFDVQLGDSGRRDSPGPSTDLDEVYWHQTPTITPTLDTHASSSHHQVQATCITVDKPPEITLATSQNVPGTSVDPFTRKRRRTFLRTFTVALARVRNSLFVSPKSPQEQSSWSIGDAALKPEHSKSKLSARITLIMQALTLLYVLNWMPHIVVRLGNSKNPINLCSSITQCTSAENWAAIAFRSFYINSSVNAFVYSFLNPTFRKACLQLFTSCFRVRRRHL